MTEKEITDRIAELRRDLHHTDDRELIILIEEDIEFLDALLSKIKG